MGDDNLYFNSRRSPVVCLHGCAATSIPLASQIGVDILKAGGNAADAAVAIAAALNVMEPTSTGLGGDAFCLYYDAAKKTIKGINGSGHSPAALTLSVVNKAGYDATHPIPNHHGFAVTVPGAGAAWVDTVEKFGSGKISLANILQPAIDLSDNGFPVEKIVAHYWKHGVPGFKDPRNTFGSEMMIHGRAPLEGEIMKRPFLAQTFRELAAHKKAAIYEGRIAQAIVTAVNKFGGVMALSDLKSHHSQFVDPISVNYKGYTVWEIPPNGQGITALIALNILENFDLKSMGHNSAEYLHTMIEATRLAFADSTWFVADPEVVQVPTDELLHKGYADERAKLIKPDSIIRNIAHGSVRGGTDTVYFTVADNQGNACSFIASKYGGFGTGIVPGNTGFTLQNRGLNFSLKPGHPNVIAPSKRPYHTIIPSMVTSTSTGELLATYGVMGGFMQPQGHIQTFLNMAEFGMDPQRALDQSRYFVEPMKPDSIVSVEEGISDDVLNDLRAKGHTVTGQLSSYGRQLFGRGQIITRGAWWKNSDNNIVADDTKVYWAGSDGRGDGVAIGY